jgi:hypothetical protein
VSAESLFYPEEADAFNRSADSVANRELCYTAANATENDMRNLIACFAALAALLCSSIAVAQCTCEKTHDRDESYRNSHYVFYAKAIENDEGELRLRVLSEWKGSRRKRTHPVADIECGFEFEVGKKYLVFGEKGEERREVVVGRCNATTQLDHRPLTPQVWSLADEATYSMSRRWAARHRRGRETITRRAVGKIKHAARKCDPDVWKGNDKMKARIEVRFDVLPGGGYSHQLLKYETDAETTDEIRQCLRKDLAEDKFRDFRGNAVSVRGYWIVDRIDASFGQDKSSAAVKPYAGNGGVDQKED